MKEIYKKIPEYPDCQISNLGNVKNDKIIKPSVRGNGFRIRLKKNGTRRVFTLHKLVASVFLGFDLKSTTHLVVHKDGDFTNNSVDNLLIRSKRSVDPNTGIARSRNGKKWRASISVLGVKKQVGMFDTKDQAIEARKKYIESL